MAGTNLGEPGRMKFLAPNRSSTFGRAGSGA